MGSLQLRCFLGLGLTVAFAVAWVWPFGGWMAFQVFVILLQNLYGPGFFLPARASPLCAVIRGRHVLTIES